MRGLLPLLAALGIVVALGLSARAQGPQQVDCTSGSCVHLPVIANPPTPTTAPTATPTTEPTVAPTPTSTPQLPTTVIVKSHRSYVQSTARYIVGEVFNGRSAAVYFVQIAARFYDASHQLVAVTDGYTFLTRTSPGQLNPFKLVLTNAPPSIVSYDLTLTWQTSSIIDYRPATVLSQQVRDNFGVEVFGEVRNDQARELRSVEVVVTFYDGAGQVVETDFGFSSALNMAPSTTSTYQISTFEEDLTFASFIVQGQGYLAP